MLTERAVEVPGTGPMAAILTEPPGGGRTDRVTVVMLNAGHLHRVGPGRLHVDLARRLARVGVASLRLDVPGVGESRERDDALGDINVQAIGDVSRALDALRRWVAAERFVLFGLCSGGELAVDAGAGDDRVEGIVSLEGYAYPTPQFLARRYLPRLVRPEFWVNRMRELATLRSGGAGASTPGVSAAEQDRPFPERELVAERFRQFVARRGRMFAAFAGGPWHYVQYEGQLREAFSDVEFGDLLTELHEPTADHLFSDLAIRERLIRRIVAFVQSLDDRSVGARPSLPDARRFA